MIRAGHTVIACVLSALAGAGAMRAERPLTLHRHEHGRALIALVGGTLSVVDSSGTPT